METADSKDQPQLEAQNTDEAEVVNGQSEPVALPPAPSPAPKKRRRRRKKRRRRYHYPADADVKTLSVPEAGRRYFNLGRNASYAAAERGDIPTIRVGRLLRAPVVALDRMLAEAGQGAR